MPARTGIGCAHDISTPIAPPGLSRIRCHARDGHHRRMWRDNGGHVDDASNRSYQHHRRAGHDHHHT
jgi:hypothetical protein